VHVEERVEKLRRTLLVADIVQCPVATAAEHKVSGPGWSECALKGLAHKPQKGDALMFYSLTPDGQKDPTSLHGSCPTLKGVTCFA